MPVPSPIPRFRAADARRLRDLLRIGVSGGRGGLLPREDELMVGFGAARPVVRAALAQLTAEGLLRPGPGAHRIVAAPPYPGPDHLHPVPGPATRPLARAGMTAPDVLADRLGVEAGSPLLRTECLAAAAGGAPVLETHYVAAPLAAALLGLPETGPFDRLLDDAGLPRGTVTARSGPVPADPDGARLLGVPPGTTLLGTERTVTATDGRVLAVGVLRAHPRAAADQPDSSARTASSVSASAGVLSGR